MEAGSFPDRGSSVAGGAHGADDVDDVGDSRDVSEDSDCTIDL